MTPKHAMTPLEFALFDTPIGACAIVWGANGLRGLQLPRESKAETRAHVAKRWKDARETTPSRPAASAMAAIIALLRGQPSDLMQLPLDMSGVPAFHRRVYEAARAIPPGSTQSYGELAAALGTPGAARAVGQALARNPFAIVVPCHRVLAARGKLGGFTATGGVETKTTLLALEGYQPPAPPLPWARAPRG